MTRFFQARQILEAEFDNLVKEGTDRGQGGYLPGSAAGTPGADDFAVGGIPFPGTGTL
jgi:hypothetical protein